MPRSAITFLQLIQFFKADWIFIFRIYWDPQSDYSNDVSHRNFSIRGYIFLKFWRRAADLMTSPLVGQMLKFRAISRVIPEQLILQVPSAALWHVFFRCEISSESLNNPFLAGYARCYGVAWSPLRMTAIALRRMCGVARHLVNENQYNPPHRLIWPLKSPLEGHRQTLLGKIAFPWRRQWRYTALTMKC